MQKIRFITIISLFLAVVCCTEEGNKNIQGGGTIVMGETGEVSTLIPVLIHDSASSSVASFMFDSLVKTGEDLEPKPHVAKSWDISLDGKKLTFYLREDVRFHDGRQLTAKDVQFTFDCIKNPNTISNHKTSLEKFESCEIIDDFTMVFHLSEPYCPAIRSAAFEIMPKHLFDTTAIQKDNAYGKRPIGTGPYILEKWDPGKIIILKANDDYSLFPNGRKPGISRIVFLYFGDQATLTMEFLAGLGVTGSVDMVPVEPQYLKKWKKDERINVQSYSGLGYGYFGFNMRKGQILEDKLVRQAICHAVNRQEMIDLIYHGDAEILNGPIHPLSRFYSGNTRSYDYNPEKAKELLAKAGWVDSNNDGTLDKNGQQLKLKLRTYTGYETTTQRCVIFQAYLKEVGIKVELDQKEWATFIKIFKEPDNLEWDVITLGWGLGLDPDSDLFTSKSIKPGGNNVIGFSNPEVDRLIENGRITCDFEDRYALYEKYQKIISEEAPYLFLWTRDSHMAVNPRFKSLNTKDILGVFWEFENWQVPPELRKY